MFKIIINIILAALLYSILGCASTKSTEGTGEYIDDAVITSKVKSEIMGASGLSSADINVETYKGVVQLSGFVKSEEMTKAVTVAKGVKGVKAVRNDMRVHP